MKFVCFLRGINVGGRVVKMADLQACFSQLGFDHVSTVLQSGNVIFESGINDRLQLKSTIESGLSSTFEYQAKVQVMSLEALAQIVAAVPFPADPQKHTYVIFFEDQV